MPRSLSIRRIDPLSFMDDASAILTAAYRPPCPHYSPAYLRFLFGFPAAIRPVGIGAFQDGHPVGFVGAAGRPTIAGDFYLSSFLAVRPTTLPSIAVALMRVECREVLKEPRPALVFVESGSVAEYLMKILDSMKLARIPAGQYRTHVAQAARPTGFEVEQQSPEKWSNTAARLQDSSVLEPLFDLHNLDHFATHPHGRKFLAVWRGGHLAGTAMQGCMEVADPRGSRLIPTLHYVRLADDDPKALAALVAQAAGPKNLAVRIPNTIRIAPAVIQGAGLQPTSLVFTAYICPNSCPVPSIRGTELEIP